MKLPRLHKPSRETFAAVSIIFGILVFVGCMVFVVSTLVNLQRDAYVQGCKHLNFAVHNILDSSLERNKKAAQAVLDSKTSTVDEKKQARDTLDRLEDYVNNYINPNFSDSSCIYPPSANTFNLPTTTTTKEK